MFRNTQKRFFSSFMKGNNNVQYVNLPSGPTIPIPLSSRMPVNVKNIKLWGEAVLNVFFTSGTPRNDEANRCISLYKAMRTSLLPTSFGKWMAVNPSMLVVGDTEDFVRDIIELKFPNQEYHADCIGCEILEAVYMDDIKPEKEDEWDISILGNNFSVVKDEQFLVRAEHSFDGRNFQEYVMKYDTGASIVGIPPNVLSFLPPGVEMLRLKDMWYINPGGTTTRARAYAGNFIRIGNLITKTTVIESRTWLLGFSVISRYNNTINVSAKDPVKMIPLSEE